ncbi:MAG: immunoglobulin domain-containing protein [Ignavibacteriae bacterium]|nr:immunoglobulin domain-containing protein [Ignavibacteriota bacterium]
MTRKKYSFGAFYLFLPLLALFTAAHSQNINFVMLYHSAWGDSRMIDSTFFNRNQNVVSHIIHFKVDPLRSAPYISFDGGIENHTKNRQQIIDDAHARGMKVLLCIGGVASGAHEWDFITRDSVLTQTVVDAMNIYAQSAGYDGFDLDWESELTLNGFKLLSRILRRTLDSWSPRGTLTAAIGRGWDPLQDVATLNAYYDYINIMTYDCNSYWSGTSGFHAPLYNPIPHYPNYDPASAALNIHNQSNTWVLHGLDKSKSSLGLPLYGWAWRGGVTAPGQSFTWIPNLAGYYNYFDATFQLDQGFGTRHYDTLAHQPWITNPGEAGGQPSYVNYEDQQSIAAKMNYLKTNGWGGVMLFSNEHAVDLSKPLDNRWPLLNAVRTSLTPPVPSQPAFTAQPQSRSVVTGAQVSFSVSATGFPAPSLRWQRSGIDIQGASSSVLVLTSVSVSDSGASFRCIASNSLGTVTSNTAILSVAAPNLAPPFFTTHPSNQFVTTGEPATFSAAASGNPSPSFQWQKNGVDIPSAINATYTTPATLPSDSGTIFRCIASNSQGTSASDAALLSVLTMPTANPISDDFASQTRFSSLWNLSSPALTGLISQGTRDAMLQFSLDTTTRDLWAGNIRAPRILQRVANGNFDVVAKFQSLPTSPYQMQGIVARGASDSWLRFDILKDPFGLKIFAGLIGTTAAEVKLNIPIQISVDPVWLRVSRQGSNWIVSYSTDNTSFAEAGRFTQAFVVDSIGVFAGNSGNPAPPFTCNVDYFFNTSNPIDPEDPTGLPSAMFTSSADSLPIGGGNVTLTWTTTDALSAAMDQGIGPVPLNGSLIVEVKQTKTFTLTVENASGSRQFTRQIFVATPSIGGSPNDVTSTGNPLASVLNPTGEGNKDIETIRDGVTPALGSTSSADQYDTENGVTTKTLEWVGYVYLSAFTFTALEFQEGLHSLRGGYFSGPPRVEVRVGDEWREVRGLQITPTYDAGAAPNYQKYRLTFDSASGNAIRIAGTPGGSHKYISIAELRAIGTVVPQPPTEELPKLFELTQNYPNPFNPTTTFTLLVASTSHIRVSIFDVLGRKVRTLLDRTIDAGTWPLTWDGHAEDGSALSSGVYLCMLEAPEYVTVRKVILAK